jgi:drug/metabolite transporter (DMT)-like permease
MMIIGITYILISSLSISIMGAFIREIGTGLPNTTILFSRFLFSLTVMLPIILRDKEFHFKVNKPLILLSRCSVGLIAMSLFFYSIQHVHLANVLLLQNTRPIFVPIIIFILTREKTGKNVIFAIIISFIGITLVINPTVNGFNPDAVYALLSGFFSAAAIILLQMFMKKNNNRAKEALFYYFLFSTIVTFIIMMFDWVTPSPRQILLLLCVGFFGTFYQLFMTVSLKYIPVKIAAPLMYFSVIFGGIIGWLVFDQAITDMTLFGILIAIFGSILVIYFNNRENLRKNL